MAYNISVLEFIGVSITSVWYLDLYRVTLCTCSIAFRCSQRGHVKRHLAVLALKKEFRTKNYIYPFQNLSLGFILKIFLKFRKFQPRYSYKIYSYKKKSALLF